MPSVVLSVHPHLVVSRPLSAFRPVFMASSAATLGSHPPHKSPLGGLKHTRSVTGRASPAAGLLCRGNRCCLASRGAIRAEPPDAGGTKGLWAPLQVTAQQLVPIGTQAAPLLRAVVVQSSLILSILNSLKTFRAHGYLQPGVLADAGKKVGEVRQAGQAGYGLHCIVLGGHGAHRQERTSGRAGVWESQRGERD